MKQYYKLRLHWIFNFTNKNFFYCVAKTLCLLVGIPIYATMFAVEMILTFVNMIFCWIPILNVVVNVICKSIIFVIDKSFYICILPDIKKFKEATKENIEYDVSDVNDSEELNQAQINGESDE